MHSTPHEREEFELHLSTCEQCRADVASFTGTAAALAYAAPPANPPAQLREEILRRAREDGPSAVVLPFRRRRVEVALSAGLAVAAAAAIVLGIWANSLHGKVDQQRSALSARGQAVAILGDPLASHRPLTGAGGQLVVARSGGVLVMPGLAAAPKGKTYEAWVIKDGVTKPAGLFSNGQDVLLGQPVTPWRGRRRHGRARRRLSAADPQAVRRRAQPSRAGPRRGGSRPRRGSATAASACCDAARSTPGSGPFVDSVKSADARSRCSHAVVSAVLTGASFADGEPRPLTIVPQPPKSV